MRLRAQPVTCLTFKLDQENSTTVSRTLHVLIAKHIVCTAAELGPHYDKLILNVTSNQSSSTPAVKFPCSCFQVSVTFPGNFFQQTKSLSPPLVAILYQCYQKSTIQCLWYILIHPNIFLWLHFCNTVKPVLDRNSLSLVLLLDWLTGKNHQVCASRKNKM